MTFQPPLRPNRFARLPRIGDGKISFLPEDDDHDGWLMLHATVRMVGKVQYAKLFAALGTFYGGGPDSSTFGLPPAGDRMPLFAGTEFKLGQTGGAKAVQLTAAQMPRHSHQGQKVGITGTPSQRALVTGVGLGDVTKPPTVMDGTGGTGEAGEGQPHENMPPYLVLNLFIFAGRPRG
jgi:microcystin-dependent protein